MPTCDNCAGTGFTCIDGKFFCLECDTQSQDFVDEQAPEVSGESSFSTKVLRKRVEKDKFHNFGRVWHTVEGYQIVVKAHVDALIKIGVNPAIASVMKQIWFKYVHATGMAVIDSDVRSETVPDKRLTFRDYFLKYHSKDDAAPSVSKLKLRFSKKSKRKRGEKLDSDSEWFSVDTEASDDDDDELLPLHSPGKYSTRRKENLSWYNVKSMSLSKIISFCYLALRWLNELYTVGDLIYWAESGIVPYYDAAGSFPTDMKLFYGDVKTFTSAYNLKYHEVLLTALRLHKYLEMPALPDVNIMGLVGRYLHQLNLPFAFTPHAKKIAQDIDLTRWPKRTMAQHLHIAVPSLKSPDLIAAAVIVIILKMFFGLDDKREWTIHASDSICDHHESTGENCVPFTWKDWVRQHLIYISHSKKSSYLLLDPLVNADEVGDVHASMEHYMDVILMGASHKTERFVKKYVRTKEFAEMRQQPFKRLVELQGSATVLNEKRDMRLSFDKVIKILGRDHKSSPGDMTSTCVFNLTRSSTLSGALYVKYDKPIGHETMGCFPNSYAFLLTLLSEITKARWLDIHKYTIVIENTFLADYFSYDE